MPNAAPFLASPLKRVVAGAIDTVLSLIVVVPVIGAIGNVRSPLQALLLVSGVYILYHVGFYWYLDDATPGQRAWNLRTVGVSGGPLSVVQTLVRPGFRVLLVCVLAWLSDLDVFWIYFRDPFFGVKAALFAPLLLELGMMFTLPSRQTLSDLVARTLVVNAPPPQPHRAPAAPMYSPSDAEFGLPPKRTK
jgi:uncharacterized RDD family membrane protein YckC